MYAALDAVMKLAIDNPMNRLRFGRVDMCDRVLEALDTYVAFLYFCMWTLLAVRPVCLASPPPTVD